MPKRSTRPTNPGRQLSKSSIPPDGLSSPIAIVDVWPVVQCGRRPAAAAVGETLPIYATVFREGHAPIAVHVLTHPPAGGTKSMSPMQLQPGAVDRWAGMIEVDVEGEWNFTIVAWSDPWHYWLERALIKIPQGLDVDFELTQGAWLLEQALQRIPTEAHGSRNTLKSAITVMRDSRLPPASRFAAAQEVEVARLLDEYPLRNEESSSGPWPLLVQRRRALVGSWYEFFPRSEGAQTDPPRSGTFRTAQKRLTAIADMGFDVVYLPPIHPIGETHRKGRNNAVACDPSDPGSPWAIGSPAGGHDSVHPDLGTIEDFDTFVSRARELDLEIALDLALQVSPDHPWVKEHPQWFEHRHDGSIAYAENPPKKYQDIYPLYFGEDPEGLYAEIERIVRFWMSHGVRIFRVDNPHTKPLWLWDRLIAAINATDPDVLFLAEAFTKPPMMKALAEIGFQQSYTYFTWRNTKQELTEYLSELAGPASAYMRPNFFTNTPDILHAYLQGGGPPAFAIRATLAATLSPTYGIYSGFELFENVAVKEDSEEYLNSEKYEFRPRNWLAAKDSNATLVPYIRRLNMIRREHLALQDLRSLRFHHTDNEHIIAFSKKVGSDIILVTCLLDPYGQHAASVWWDMEALGIDAQQRFIATDLITQQTWTWGQQTYVELRPHETVAHIVSATVPQ